MSVELTAAIEGRLTEWTSALSKAVEQGQRSAVRRAVFGMRNAVRSTIRSGGLRNNFSRLVVAHPPKPRGDAEGVVRSVARYSSGGARTSPVDLVMLYSQGATIRAARRQWLAIPTGQGPRTNKGRGSGRRFATPEEAAGQGWRLTFVPARGGNAILVRKQVGRPDIVTHVLVKQVGLRARYSLAVPVNRWVDRLPSLLNEEINKAFDKSPVLAGRI